MSIISTENVDHGKTSLLDKIRGTSVVKGEAGAITQTIGATKVPTELIKKIAGNLLEKMNIKLTIPGLLFVDTPGHEAFTTLRKRGGAIADLAILVIDVMEGFQPQTEESLNYLKQFKTPFMVAITKLDRIAGWMPQKDKPFTVTYNCQSERVQDALEEKIYKIIGQLGVRGFEAERIDRISDFSKQIAVVPICAHTGEGLPELLMTLSGISQKFLKRGLILTNGEGKGTVLEVKNFRGLGTTIDVILYDGDIKRGDCIIIGGNKIIKTKVKALLEPEILKELKNSNFVNVDTVSAAAGIKIAASDLEDVIPGSPLRAVANESDIDQAIEELRAEVEEVEIETQNEGTLLKTDTLGGLEALIKTLKDKNVPIRKAVVGNITKSDIMEMRVLKDPVIFGFNIKIDSNILKMAQDNNISVFHSDVIYRLVEDYEKWKKDERARKEARILESITRPGRVRVLPGYVFRASKPAIFGVEVLKGTLKSAYRLKKGNDIVGEIKELQLRGDNISKVKMGDKVAVSMQGVTIGKEIIEGDVLNVFLSHEDVEKLKKIESKLTPDERELLDEYQ